ncbi:hypothetical protein HOD05_00935 [Candidatus Woesearchaeota archaeon]|jgi:hypothetical protein|nr:hypothetical protein [Candidatus Woesearchaeota archaeon]MBT4150972.1 hypothetical protein [Candidatus Woesearchaeota archaeon]MBT4247345.1 hypothetical protein [Candidatus Woesearchaeota archaeon]MBT4433762.1 hypothetical protein [Candidatus Woesearchaeota archaeon]MBT7331905.1 hypothetical protein [Candidatus Woesearchaeota archaeon]
MRLFKRTKPNEILMFSNEASNQARVVAKLEKEFLKYAKIASAKTYQTNEERKAVREVFSNKLEELRHALMSLRAKAVNLEMKSVKAITSLGSKHLDLVKSAPKALKKKVIKEEIKVQNEIVGYSKEEERIWAEIKAEAMAETKNLQSQNRRAA